MKNNITLDDCIVNINTSRFNPANGDEYSRELHAKSTEIQQHFLNRVEDLLDTKALDKLRHGSDLEILMLVDENDSFYRNKDDRWACAFRKDCSNYRSLPESTERPIFVRVVLSILEDMEGNIIISQRSIWKSPLGIWEIPGGHVIAWDDYLETCKKEFREELWLSIDSLSENDRLFKYRKVSSEKIPGTHGKWSIITIYRVKIPEVSALKPNAEEIQATKVISPEDLLNMIRDKILTFDPTHAYIYLEYLKSRLSEDRERILKVQRSLNLLHSLTQLDTSSD